MLLGNLQSTEHLKRGRKSSPLSPASLQEGSQQLSTDTGNLTYQLYPWDLCVPGSSVSPACRWQIMNLFRLHKDMNHFFLKNFFLCENIITDSVMEELWESTHSYGHLSCKVHMEAVFIFFKSAHLFTSIERFHAYIV